ncbi:MAG TPA: cbb3-type cytochrome c oxidase subunit I [Gemmatimonadaceae bacterium]|nr:cbb3-type cytochrome c oxidase subunit I [Gemmatimonadaceae bacterium]
MYTLVRRYLKTAIAFLAVGLLLGVWMIARRELVGAAPSSYLTSAHTHALFVGFVMMMIMGVALWLFPRPDKSDARYDPRLASAAYWLLTGATAARIGGEIMRSSMSYPWLRLSVVGAGIVQLAAIGLFFYTMWARIRPVGSQGREAKGERF